MFASNFRKVELLLCIYLISILEKCIEIYGIRGFGRSRMSNVKAITPGDLSA